MMPLTNEKDAPRDRASPAPRKRRWAALFALVAAGLLLFLGSLRSKAGSASGTTIHGAAAANIERPVLRIAAFNIRAGLSREGRESLAQTGGHLKGFDLVGLNEVHGATLLHWEDQAAILGQQIGAAWLFAPAERRWWRNDWGNALLTTLRISQWQREQLPGTRSKGFRNYLLVTAIHQGRPASVLITHLDTAVDRDAQMRIVLDVFASLPEPAILLGDLNAPVDHPILRRFIDAGAAVDALGAETGARVDWILVRGYRVLRSGLRDTQTSDHPMCWAEIEPIRGADAPSPRPGEAPVPPGAEPRTIESEPR